MFVDIGIAVILLIGLIAGIVRGFGRSFLKLISIAVAFVLTWRLTPYVMKFMFETDIFSQLIYGEGLSLCTLFSDASILAMAENSVFLKAICEPLLEYLVMYEPTAEQVAYFMPYLLAVFSATVIASLLVYLVVRLLIMIIVSIIKAIFFKYKPKGWSRFFGGILGIVNSAVAVLWILLLASSVSSMTPIAINVANQTKDSIVVNTASEFVLDTYNKYMVQENYLEKAIDQAIRNLPETI